MDEFVGRALHVIRMSYVVQLLEALQLGVVDQTSVRVEVREDEAPESVDAAAAAAAAALTNNFGQRQQVQGAGRILVSRAEGSKPEDPRTRQRIE